jgi:hypothetical protein
VSKLEPIGEWQMPASELDGFRSPLTLVQEWQGELYIAGQRRGIIKLEPQVVNGNQIAFVESGMAIMNTPSQAGGIIVGEFDLNGVPTVLMVEFDHGDGGIKPFEPPPCTPFPCQSRNPEF